MASLLYYVILAMVYLAGALGVGAIFVIVGYVWYVLAAYAIFDVSVDPDAWKYIWTSIWFNCIFIAAIVSNLVQQYQRHETESKKSTMQNNIFIEYARAKKNKYCPKVNIVMGENNVSE